MCTVDKVYGLTNLQLDVGVPINICDRESKSLHTHFLNLIIITMFDIIFSQVSTCYR